MPTGADPLRGGDACIYQIKTNPVSPSPAPAGGRAPAALVTLDNLGPIARPPWRRRPIRTSARSEEHTSELQSHSDLVCRLLLEKKNFVKFSLLAATDYKERAKANRSR